MTTSLDHRGRDARHDSGPDSEQFQRHARFPHHLGVLLGASGRDTGVGSCGDAIADAYRPIDR